MSSGTSSLTILSEEQKFNGENLLKWNITMLQLLGSKGLTRYTDGTITKPAAPVAGSTPPDTTPIYSANPNYDEWVFRDQLAQGHITLNCTDIAGLGVKTTGTAKEAWCKGTVGSEAGDLSEPAVRRKSHWLTRTDRKS